MEEVEQGIDFRQTVMGDMKTSKDAGGVGRRSVGIIQLLTGGNLQKDETWNEEEVADRIRRNFATEQGFINEAGSQIEQLTSGSLDYAPNSVRANYRTAVATQADRWVAMLLEELGPELTENVINQISDEMLEIAQVTNSMTRYYRIDQQTVNELKDIEERRGKVVVWLTQLRKAMASLYQQLDALPSEDRNTKPYVTLEAALELCVRQYNKLAPKHTGRIFFYKPKRF
jgi:hypothetical protein